MFPPPSRPRRSIFGAGAHTNCPFGLRALACIVDTVMGDDETAAPGRDVTAFGDVEIETHDIFSLSISATYCSQDSEEGIVQLSRLERPLTKYFVVVTAGAVVIAWAGIVAVLISGATVDKVTKLVDVAFKVAAVIVASCWALNRYFTARTDALQLRIDPTVEFVDDPEMQHLLICRLDVVNTGRALLPSFQETLKLQSVRIEGAELTYDPFFNWPEAGFHSAGSIEPGSSSAVSVAVPLARKVRVVQAYLELRFADGSAYTWHRHFTAPILEQASSDPPTGEPQAPQITHTSVLPLRAERPQYHEPGGVSVSRTGEKPGKGTYTCKKCGQTVVLDDDSDTLPPCPKCGGSEFRP